MGAIQILRSSFHRCGHGSDVGSPYTLAEQAFASRPYTTELFDAVAFYRKSLQGTRAAVANNVKGKLAWVLWHDPRRIEKHCFTRKLQLDLRAMDPETRFRWQWLFRHSSPGSNHAPGRAWLKEAEKRFAAIGEREFLERLDEWFTFPEGEVSLKPAGSSMLRLLVWHAGLADTQKSLPILARLEDVNWTRIERAHKVLAAFEALSRAAEKGTGWRDRATPA